MRPANSPEYPDARVLQILYLHFIFFPIHALPDSQPTRPFRRCAPQGRRARQRIPLQSRALAILLNMPDSEADIWIGWGTHVFREGDGRSKGTALEVYLNSLIDRAEAAPGDDFFSGLTRATFRGRPLTREEMLGYGSIMFAGGRDTLVNSISGIIGHASSESKTSPHTCRRGVDGVSRASSQSFAPISAGFSSGFFPTLRKTARGGDGSPDAPGRLGLNGYE